MKNKIINTINDALKSMDYPLVNISIEKPKNKKNGDISSNIAFLLSKEFKIDKEQLIIKPIKKPSM